MPEKCTASDCPVNARVDALEPEVKQLKGGA